MPQALFDNELWRWGLWMVTSMALLLVLGLLTWIVVGITRHRGSRDEKRPPSGSALTQKL